ncbi:PLP-dependent aspartate aminotransferase family protein [Modestobacter sp. Leaf380]|uniref:trans-sulfuration enzyme family protein n=1 Tax=Modestobacter sp. Leaf380 TaxID=1736356 RepID=UPI0006F99FB9|nr:PLP-dependent aspartate aminotransferase family protein [Modestobacter sp. Leaf380]KQS66701.1 cystathionine gamma-synthase [Modestobacter sp. Leaf380]
MDTEQPHSLRVETRLVGLGRGQHRAGQPLNVPVVLASTFRAPGSSEVGREYARDDGTPGWEALEELVDDLEGGPAVAFSSGMAAIAAVLELLPVGARVVVPQDSYTGLRGLLADGAAAGGRWDVVEVDATDTDALLAAVAEADLVWVESPSNPLLHLVDIEAVTRAAHAAGARVAVDNTFATPLLQNPLQLGADVVVHSATKAIGGHSDLLLGLVAVRDPADRERLTRRREVGGATPGSLECYLALRGARTLALRVERAQASAGELARRLAAHPAGLPVGYPGLPDHPQHALAVRQMRGPGIVLTLELPDARLADAFCERVTVVAHATSLGGVESTLERRAKLPGQEHVPAGLVRISVGCEHVEDLWADLSGALDAVLGEQTPRH